MAAKVQEAKGFPTVFVYGTLKRAHSNHRFLKTSMFIGRTFIEGPYKMVSLGPFPGVIDAKDGNRRVYGEVYRVDGDTLSALDLLEGHPHFYKREKVLTEFGKTWVYFLQTKECEDMFIPTGMWEPINDELEYWKAKEAEDGSTEQHA